MISTGLAWRLCVVVPSVCVLMDSPESSPASCVRESVRTVSADTLDGRVMSEDGETPIPGASVRVRLEDHVREVTSDSSGRYVFADLSAGRHELRVEAAGYRSMEVVVYLPEGGRSTVDVLLERDGGADGFLFASCSVSFLPLDHSSG